MSTPEPRRLSWAIEVDRQAWATVYADPGEIFAPEAASSWVGQAVTVTASDRSDVGRVSSAVVTPDGRGIQISIEFPERSPMEDA